MRSPGPGKMEHKALIRSGKPGRIFLRKLPVKLTAAGTGPKHRKDRKVKVEIEEML